MTDRVYLDFNATTPLAPEVSAAMRPFLENAFGNPSSPHWAGLPARDAVEAARSQVAALLRCDATEVIFTSGGTEANNLAIKGTYFAAIGKNPRPHFISTNIEHPAVLEPLAFVERLGAHVTLVPVDQFGLVDPDDVRRAIRPETVLISVMHANNEVGTVQPIEEIARAAHKCGVLCHTDAAQSVGKIDVDTEELCVDLLTVAGHKLYGPKGVGALFVREGVRLEPLMHGASHEAARRAGTENVLEIVGLGAACAAAAAWIGDQRVQALRDRLWQRLAEQFGEQISLNGHPDRRLPNTLNLSFHGYVGSEILAKLPSVAASTGAACHAGKTEMSAVLRSMGADETTGLGAIRFSLGRPTTQEEVDRVIELLVQVLQRKGMTMVNAKSHWEGVYTQKAVNEVGWYKPDFDVSLGLIAEASTNRSASIIDVGGGASLLVDSLLHLGYKRVAVLDIAAAALEHAKRRLGVKESDVQWIVADIRDTASLGLFDIWHDRAVFHFLVDAADRQKYADLARKTIPVGGHAIIATFAPNGPQKCSGLETCRYSSHELAAEFGEGFELVKEVPEVHTTPSGKSQAFAYTLLRRV